MKTSKKPENKKRIVQKVKPIKPVTVTLNFGAERHCLYSTRTANFISKQPGRFALLEGEPCLTGTTYFCDTYLEAHFVMALENGVALYSDEYATLDGLDYGTFVVVSKKNYSFK